MQKVNATFFLNRFILFFFVFICLFPTLRMLLIGGEEMKGAVQVLITALPDILLFIALGLAFLVFRGRKKACRLSFFDKAVLFFFLFNTLLGFILAGDLLIAFRGFRITYLPITFYFIARLYSCEEKHFSSWLADRIFKWLALFSLAGWIVHFGFREFETYMYSMTGHEVNEYFIPRLASLLWTPVLFGTLMAMTTVYFYYRVLCAGTLFRYLLFAFSWCSLLLTVSRGPILACIIGFIVLSIFFRKWRKVIFSLFLLLVSALAVSIYATGDATLLKWIISSTGETLSMKEGLSRVERWRITFENLKERPWGYGLGKAGAIAFRFLKDTGIPSAPYSTDGWYLKIACETGIAGLVSYLALIGINFFRLLKGRTSNPGLFIYLGLALLLMINAQNVVANTLDFYPYICIYWLMIGFSENEIQGARL